MARRCCGSAGQQKCSGMKQKGSEGTLLVFRVTKPPCGHHAPASVCTDPQKRALWLVLGVKPVLRAGIGAREWAGQHDGTDCRGRICLVLVKMQPSLAPGSPACLCQKLKANRPRPQHCWQLQHGRAPSAAQPRRRCSKGGQKIPRTGTCQADVLI